MLKVGIIGATGYAGEELIKLLLNHPQVKITLLQGLVEKSTPIENIFKNLRSRTDLLCTNLDLEQIISKVDLVFLALPHKVSMEIVPTLLKHNKRVIDLSADFRLKDPLVYEKWYQIKHVCPQFINEAVYGLPELYRSYIKKTNLIANPGCYPTSIILGLAPLIKNSKINLDQIIVDSKSGITGAGRMPTPKTHFPNCYENFSAYGIFSHRHTPEIDQELSFLACKEVKIVFTPHLLPINRGILSTIYVDLKNSMSQQQLLEIYINFYKKEPYIRILKEGELPQIKDVAHTNYCDLGIFLDKNRKKVLIISCIDNLIKGASGQAVQNMNIMYDYKESSAL
ncbi:MAG: N-acetyl-gamma-glutamyl-phosphate reductase [bacterium]|nr:N-acetyl-gamma-glutamyl-phosphate reductase [bacterium]